MQIELQKLMHLSENTGKPFFSVFAIVFVLGIELYHVKHSFRDTQTSILLF
jgi:hypothetical protein